MHLSSHTTTFQKLSVPSNFTTSIFIGCEFTNFTVDWLSSAIFLIDSSIQCKKRLVKINSNRKDRSLPPNETINSLQIDLLHLNEKLPVEPKNLWYHLLGIHTTKNSNTREKSPITRTNKQRKERENTRFNVVWEFSYVLEATERVLIESINYKLQILETISLFI